jgi:hypothetical protein
MGDQLVSALPWAVIKLALLLAILCVFGVTLDSRVQAQATPPKALQLPPPRAPETAPEGRQWNAEREAWYRRNRAISTTGKVAAAIGLATFVTSWTFDNLGGLIAGGVLQSGGLLMWASSDLKATKRFRTWGFRLRKEGAVVSVIGVFTAIPATLVAGSWQSASIRRLHQDIVRGSAEPAATLRVTGAGLRFSF